MVPLSASGIVDSPEGNLNLATIDSEIGVNPAYLG